jgi:hypothetical protein
MAAGVSLAASYDDALYLLALCAVLYVADRSGYQIPIPLLLGYVV